MSELAAPLLGKLAALRSGGKSSPPEKWRRGILIGAGHLGDILYNTGSLPALKKGLPECEWHFLVRAPSDQIIAYNPYVSRSVSSLRELSDIDVVINYDSGAYVHGLLDAAKHGIPNRVGYVHKGFSGLVTHPIAIQYPQPFTAYFRDLVKQLTGQQTNWRLRPLVYPQLEHAAAARASWDALTLHQPVLACFLTSRQQAGVWPARKFAETIRFLERTTTFETILLGAPSDFPILQKLRREFAIRGKIAPPLPLLALVAFLKMCQAVFSTDSGSRHLANAAEVPVIYVRNISFSKVEAGRYTSTEFDLAPDVEFVRPDEETEAFSSLVPEQVASRIASILRSLWKRR